MGSKGNQVSSTQTQSYTPNPAIAAAGQQAITGAQTAAQAPFQMPVAPVAQFSPFQQMAFGETLGMQGMAQPYFNMGTNYLQGSAAPITGQDVSQYYNPMAQNVFNQMGNIFGRQMQETTGNLTQAAGGVGADRIAVGQANLANQQGLAAGQTAAQLYSQALQAAQQQKQMMAGAGYGIGQMGPAAQAAQLQGIGALGAAGGLQQQLSQAQLNAMYQNQLAQIAYPFQTPQYLAGITGGLAPAMGGTTQGQSTTTYPTPSPLAQGLGIGTSLLGMGMGGMFGNLPGNMMGSLKGGTGGNTYMPMSGYPGMMMGWYGGTPYPMMNRGGAAMADGGSTYGELAKNIYARSPFGDPYSDNPMQSGGVADDQPQGPAVPGLHIPKTGASPIPTVSLPMGAGHSGLMTGGLNLQKELPYAIGPHGMVGSYPGSGQSSSVPTEALRMAQVLGNYAYSRGGSAGGAVSPMDIGQPFQEGGDATFDERFAGINEPRQETPMPQARPMGALSVDPSASMPDAYRGSHSILRDKYGPTVASGVMGNLAVESPNLNPMESHDQGTGEGIAGWRLDRRQQMHDYANAQGLDPYDRRTQLSFLGHDLETNYPDLLKRMQSAKDPADAARMFRMEYERPAGTTQGAPLGMGQAAQYASNFHSGDFSNVGDEGGAGRARFASYQPMGAGLRPGPTAAELQLPAERLPYPDALNRDWGQQATRSPWMSLVKAGAAMATTAGPIGSVIGQGIKAGAGELEGQRKSLQNEEQINQKAQALYQQAQLHLDQYAREQWKPTYSITREGHPILYEGRSGRTIDSVTGEPIRPDQEITSTRGAGAPTPLQKNTNWMIAQGIAKDSTDAFNILHSSMQNPARFNQLLQQRENYIRKQQQAGDDEFIGLNEAQVRERAIRDIREGATLAPGLTGSTTGSATPAEKTIKRTGTINAGPNAGKKIIEYSDGTQEIK